MSRQTYELPLFPLDTVLFPGMVLPLHIFEEHYKFMIRRCIAEEQPFGVVLLREGRAEGGVSDNIYEIGTTARITQVNQLPDDRFQILSLGVQRFRIRETHHLNPYLTGLVEAFPLVSRDLDATQKSARRMSRYLLRFLDIFKEVGKLEFDFDKFPDDPTTLAFLSAIVMPIENADKQDLLSRIDIQQLLDAETEMLKREIMYLNVTSQNQPAWAEDSSFSLN